MSLHIGRLSPDVRQPDLEHLFRKYGHCVVNLKDGYGFAVYTSNADAARALRALHGTHVCGCRVTVNWSKQQPRFSQGFRGSSRFAEPSHRMTSRNGRENIRFRHSIAVKNHLAGHDECHHKSHQRSRDNNSLASYDENHEKNYLASRDESHDPASAQEKEYDRLAEGVSHEKNYLASRDESHDPASEGEKEYDKLAEGVSDAGENIVEEEALLGEVKKYEGGAVDASAIEHERWAEAGKGTHGDGDGFEYEPYQGLGRQKQTEDVMKASSWDSHDHGRSSEKWQEHSDKRVDISHEDKSRFPSTCYTCGASGHIARYCPQEMDVKFNTKRDGLHFREKMELRQRRFGLPSKRRPEYHVHPMDIKHRRVQDGRKPLSDIKKGEVPRSSNVHRENRRPDHNNENVQQALKETCKRSRSQRSRGSSLSSEPSNHPRQDNIKGSHSNRTSSDSRCGSPHSLSHFREHSPSSSAHSSSKSSQPTRHKGLRLNINHHAQFSTSALPQLKSSPAKEDKNPNGLMNFPLEEGSEFRSTPEIKRMDNNKQEGNGSALNSEVPITSFKVDTLSNEEALVPDKCANVTDYAGVNLDKSSSRYNDNNVASGLQSQNANFDDTSSAKSNLDIQATKGRRKSLKLTTDEVISALKHYKMETREVNSLDQPVEKYFGAARLWPWEIIYYRRLKKGSISTENYARRLEQNKEFGIVDQYVRSSSGWWEYH